jgi:hypothetical protein
MMLAYRLYIARTEHSSIIVIGRGHQNDPNLQCHILKYYLIRVILE